MSAYYFVWGFCAGLIIPYIIREIAAVIRCVKATQAYADAAMGNSLSILDLERIKRTKCRICGRKTEVSYEIRSDGHYTAKAECPEGCLTEEYAG